MSLHDVAQSKRDSDKPNYLYDSHSHSLGNTVTNNEANTATAKHCERIY
jgi:hypothetical protein